MVAEIRDGIHLAAIGGLSPLEEFQKRVAQSFERTHHSVEDRVIERFTALQVTADGIDLGAVGLRGPASTWTYLVQDDALKDPIAAALVGQRHIGFAVNAALAGPFLILWMLVRRFQKRQR